MSAKQHGLRNVPLFRDLDDKELARLEHIGRERTFKAGSPIIQEGDEGVGFFLITEGTVDVTRGGSHLASFGPGDFFGEMALLDNYRRSATVTAVSDVSALALLRSDFIAELRANVDLAIALLVWMSRRLRDADEALANALQ